MSDEAKNRWGADPELYRQLCEPHATKEEAEKAMCDFLDDVAELRKKYRIPELCIHLELLIQAESDEQVYRLSGGAGWGDQMRQAELCRRMYEREFEHLAAIINELSGALPQFARLLITEPKGKDVAYEQ